MWIRIIDLFRKILFTNFKFLIYYLNNLMFGY